MREVKFRAWDTEEEKWWPKDHDEWINVASGGDIVYGYADGDPEDAEGRFEIVWYTGLTDKNGVEIYEGDVYEYNGTSYAENEDNEMEERFEVKTSVVEYREGVISIGYQFMSHHTNIEVIGNIYEGEVKR